MKRLDGREVAEYLMQRHTQQARRFAVPPRLAIVREGATPATDMFLRVKQRYGYDVGIPVDLYTETPDTLLDRIQVLNHDPAVTGINVELPLATAPLLTDQALAAVVLPKDIEGLAHRSTFEVVTPKAILWLLAAYNTDLSGKQIVVIGQGQLVGKPLTARLRASGLQVLAIDVTTPDAPSQIRAADIVISATGAAASLTSDMLKPGAVVVDAGAPLSDVHADVLERDDLTITPNPGGVGPMTVAALFDNLLIAAQAQARHIASKP